jgi:hypothetical protein
MATLRLPTTIRALSCPNYPPDDAIGLGVGNVVKRVGLLAANADEGLARLLGAISLVPLDAL